MQKFLLLLPLLAACNFNPNREPHPPEHDGPSFYIHGFPVYTAVYYGNHCFMVDFHDPKVPGIDGFQNKERYMLACSGH